MTLPNRLEIVKEFTDLAWQPRRSPNPGRSGRDRGP
jgi:hypothetical protein